MLSDSHGCRRQSFALLVVMIICSSQLSACPELQWATKSSELRVVLAIPSHW